MNRLERSALVLLALVAFLAPLKFGVPVVLQWRQVPPADLYTWLFYGWPVVLGVMLVFAGSLVWATGARIWMQQRDLLYWLPAVWLLTQAVAVPGSIHRQASLDMLMHAGACVVLFYAAAWHVRDGAAAVRVFQALGLATFLVCIHALDQKYGFLTGGFKESAGMIGEMEMNPANAAAMKARLESGRVFATFAGYPNALAAFLVMGLGPVLGWILTRARLWQRPFKWAILGCAGLILGWVFWLTGSRGGFVALTVVLMAGGISVALGSESSSKRVGLAMAKVAGAALALFVVLAATGYLPRGDSSAMARFDYWGGAIEIGRDHPWFGTGPGTFGSIYPAYKTAATEEAKTVHNDYLQMWSDSGWVAMFVYLAIWILALRDAVRLVRARRGDTASVALLMFLAGWTAHSLIDFDLYIPGLAWPAFVMLGMTQGLKELVPVTGTSEARGPRVVVWSGCLVLVVLFTSYGSGLLKANLAYGRSQEFDVERGTWMPLVYRLEAAKEAVRLAPSVAYYAVTAGDLAMARRNFGAAEQYYRQAIGADPYRWAYHRRLADVKKDQGQMAEAIASLQRAAELNRNNDELQQLIAQWQALSVPPGPEPTP
jgi:O-antigen ligase